MTVVPPEPGGALRTVPVEVRSEEHFLGEQIVGFSRRQCPMDFLYEPHGILLLSLQLVAVLFSVDTPGAVLCLMEFPAQSLSW